MQGKMKAQVFYEPEKMSLEEVDIPKISPDEVLIKVKTCGICGSDIAYYFGLSPLETPDGKGPLILGHELAGEVVEVGEIPENLHLFEPKDRVVVEPVQYCNTCELCKQGMVNLCEKKSVLGVSVNGGFAEFVRAKYQGVHKLPPDVSFEEAALVEPLSNALYAIENLNPSIGDYCVVFGPGPIGNMMVQLLKSRGAGKIILVGTRDYRLEMGKEAGADFILNTKEKNSRWYTDDLVEEVKKITGAKMANRVICATGAVEPMQKALDISGRRAVIVYFGLPGPDDVVKLPLLESLLMDKTIRFSWLSPLTWPATVQCIATGVVKVKKLITHRFSLEDTLEGLKVIKNREGNAMKGIVIFP